MWLNGIIDPFMSLDLVHENLTHFYNCVIFASLQPFSRGTAICLVPGHLEKVEDKNNQTMGLSKNSNGTKNESPYFGFSCVS